MLMLRSAAEQIGRKYMLGSLCVRQRLMNLPAPLLNSPQYHFRICDMFSGSKHLV
jgi:hypothetical protein